MDIIQKITTLFLHPEKFFGKVEKEDYWPSWQLFVGLYIGLVAIGFVGYLAILSNTIGTPFGMTELMFGLVVALGVIIISAISPWISAAFLHIGPMLLGGKTYLETFKASTYTQIIRLAYSIPVLIIYGLLMVSKDSTIVGLVGLGVLLLISLVSVVHVVYALTMGFKELHRQTTGIAFVCAFVIPMAVAFVMYIIVYFLMIMFVLGAVSLTAVA